MPKQAGKKEDGEFLPDSPDVCTIQIYNVEACRARLGLWHKSQKNNNLATDWRQCLVRLAALSFIVSVESKFHGQFHLSQGLLVKMIASSQKVMAMTL